MRESGMTQLKSEWRRWIWLWGNICFPITLLLIGLVFNKGSELIMHEVDWQGTSLPARALNATLLLHLAYVVATILLLKGWRIPALLIGLIALTIAFVIYFLAYLAVTLIFI
jgi:hypothetical protein